MKNLIFLSILVFSLFSISAFAKKQEPEPKAQQPKNYSEFFLLNTNEGRTGPTKLSDVSDCVSTIARLKVAARAELESSCTEVLYKTTINDIPAGNYRYYRNIVIEYYCKPRSFSEMAIMSLYKKCIESPQQECFSSDMLEKLNKVKSTTYTEQANRSC